MGGLKWFEISAPVCENDQFVTAQAERQVTVWSLKRRQKTADLSTVFEFGGQRLTFIPGAQPIVVAGTYYADGVCAYEVTSGSRIWQRKDLRQVQTLQWIPSGIDSGLVGAGFDSRPYVLLDVATGSDITTIRAVRALYTSPYGGVGLQVTARDIRLCSLDDWCISWKQPLRSWGVLHAAFGPASLVVSEVAGAVRCFGLDGMPLWEWSPGEGSHCLKVAWCEHIHGWVAVEWAYKKGGPKRLVQLLDGAIRKTDIGPVVDLGFFAGGRHMITTQGQVLDVPSLDCTWVFDERPLSGE